MTTPDQPIDIRVPAELRQKADEWAMEIAGCNPSFHGAVIPVGTRNWAVMNIEGVGPRLVGGSDLTAVHGPSVQTLPAPFHPISDPDVFDLLGDRDALLPLLGLARPWSDLIRDGFERPDRDIPADRVDGTFL